MGLSDEQIQSYKRDGFLSRIPIADESESIRIREQFNALEEAEGRERAQIGLLDRHFDHEFIHSLAINPAILDCVQALIGPDILLLATHFFCKYGRGEAFVAWHQDVTYWALDPPAALTAWYAVDDSDRENGCMRVIPGSHTSGIRQHGKANGAGNLLSVNQEIAVTETEALSAVHLEIRAGEISLHDGALIHGSLPNSSDRRRCGLTLRYIPAHVRSTGPNAVGRRWSAIVVRGEDRFGNWSLSDP